MDPTTRRRTLAAAVTLAFATVAFAGGGYTVSLLSDEERTGASIQAASDFAESPSAGEAVTFRGCGAVRLRMPADASLPLAVTVYDPATDDRETVTFTDADAESEASGFQYVPAQDRYQFDLESYQGASGEAKIVSVKLDGETVTNTNRCARVGTGGDESAGRAGASGATTVGNTAAGNTAAGNAATGDADSTTGRESRGSDTDGADSSGPSDAGAETTAAPTTTAREATTTETTTHAATTTTAKTTATTTAETTGA